MSAAGLCSDWWAVSQNGWMLSSKYTDFRSKLSTETVISTVTDKIYSNMGNNKIFHITLCDLSKAFDSINHDIVTKLT